MDKESYRQIKFQNSAIYELDKEISQIEKITINESLFHDKKSLEAFKIINEYLKNKKNELKILSLVNRDNKKEFINSCNHEIGIKDAARDDYYCLICQLTLICGQDKACKLLIDISKESCLTTLIDETFEKVVYSDKDLVSTMEKELQNIQYEHEVKIIRR